MALAGTHIARSSRHAGLAALLFAALCTVHPAKAEFPERPVRIVIPFPAGGPADVVARIIAPQLGERLGKPVLVESRPGANGNLATEHVARSPADGHTLLLASDGQIVVSPHLYRMSVDPLTSLVPVTPLGSSDLMLVVNARVPAHSLAEFVALARQANPPLTYGSIGSGSVLHLVMEMFKQRAGIELVHVPYRGGEASSLALRTGEVQASISGNAAIEHVRSGELRGLASTGRRRTETYFNLPALAETYPGFEAQVWIGLFAPAGIPPAVLDRLRAELDEVLDARETIERIQRANGFDIYRASPEDFTARIEAEYARYGDIAKRVRLSVD